MIRLCRVADVRAAEQSALRAGRSEKDLMCDAGSGVAQAILRERIGGPGAALFLVGPGSNGGDGLVAAATLASQGWQVRIWSHGRNGLAGAPVDDAAASRLEWLTGSDDLDGALRGADVVVDAVFGVGGRPELPEPVAWAFRAAWDTRVEQGIPMVALDIPSGVDADSGAADPDAFRADLTLTVGLPKIGLYRGEAVRRAGRLALVEIGLTAPQSSDGEPALITEGDARRWLPRRSADTHKRQVGTLLVVGGAPNYYGAPRMAAAAAGRVGAGLVSLAVPRSLIGPISTALPEATFVPLPEGEFGGAGSRAADLVRKAAAEANALLIGPGLGQDSIVDEFLDAFFGARSSTPGIGFGAARSEAATERFTGRAVVDADGLNWLSRHADWPDRLRGASLVLTPHPGELGRLLGIDTTEIVERPWESATEAAARFGQVIVLKHAHTVIAHPDGDLHIAPQALPSLASAGTGDVLAGTIAGLLAQGLTTLEAAACGVYVGTLAALAAEATTGTLGLVAPDVIGATARAVSSLYDARW